MRFHVAARTLLLRYCDPTVMEKHEKRNEQPPIEDRSIELLIYGVFTAFEGDKGEYCTQGSCFNVRTEKWYF